MATICYHKKMDDLELYSDYLISRFGAVTATGLSEMVNGEVSHDHFTRFLSKHKFTSKDLWDKVKTIVRKIEAEGGVLIFDDTVQEKAFTDENDIICWHYEHSTGQTVKGLNILNALYLCQEISIPVAYEIIAKPIQYYDLKKHKMKRISEVTKNELMRNMFTVCIQNTLKFKYVLMDCWFAAVDNFEFIRKEGKHFIAGLKDNRLVALSKSDKQQGQFTNIGTLSLPENQAVKGWLKGYAQQVLLVRQVFKNKDGSTGISHLVCSDLEVDWGEITMTYKKRWAIEVFHKSLKSNAGLAKSPTRRVTTQSNHIFMSIYAVFKLECLKLKSALNHFAIRAKLLINITRQAYRELQMLRIRDSA